MRTSDNIRHRILSDVREGSLCVMYKKKPLSAAVVVAGFLLSCSASPIIEGTWGRPVCDEEMGISGFEYLYLKADSTFLQTDTLVMHQSDTLASMSYSFSVAISGVWSHSPDGSKLCLHYDTASFVCDSVPGLFHVIPAGDAARTSELRHQLAAGLSEMYRNIYSVIASHGPLEVDSVSVANDGKMRWRSEGGWVEWFASLQ